MCTGIMAGSQLCYPFNSRNCVLSYTNLFLMGIANLEQKIMISVTMIAECHASRANVKSKSKTMELKNVCLKPSVKMFNVKTKAM